MLRKFPQGFTLIELMVVISIIGVLAGVGVSNISGSLARGRDSRRKADLNAIRTALELYRQDTGSYPTSTYVSSTNPSHWIPELTSQYIKNVPIDPVNTGSYTYEYIPYYCSTTP